MTAHRDQDRLKGALEQDERHQPGNNSLKGQISHRCKDPLLDGYDTDFPEPGESPEHSGEPQEVPEKSA